MIKITEIHLVVYYLIVKIIVNIGAILALILCIPFYLIEVLVNLGSNVINYLMKLWYRFTKNKDNKL